MRTSAGLRSALRGPGPQADRFDKFDLWRPRTPCVRPQTCESSARSSCYDCSRRLWPLRRGLLHRRAPRGVLQNSRRTRALKRSAAAHQLARVPPRVRHRHNHAAARAGQDAKSLVRGAAAADAVDDELIQWDATPQENDEYASNPASDLAGFVHALSGDDHTDRRSCGLANMLGSEARRRRPTNRRRPPWEDGPRRRGASRPPLAENTVPLSAARRPCLPKARPAGRRRPRSRARRTPRSTRPSSSSTSPRPRLHRSPRPRPRPPARRPPRRPPAPRARRRRGRGRARSRRPTRAASTRARRARRRRALCRRGHRRRGHKGRGDRPRCGAWAGAATARRGRRRNRAATATRCRGASQWREARPAAGGSTAPAPPRPTATRPRPRGTRSTPRSSPSTSPPRRRRRAAPTGIREAGAARPAASEANSRAAATATATATTTTGDRTTDLARRGAPRFRSGRPAAEARAAVQTKRCRIVSVQGRGEALSPSTAPRRRLRLTGDWARAELRAGARGHLVPWAAVGEPCVTPQSLPDDITIDQASPYFWVACPEVFVSPTAVVAATACERRAWLTSTGGSGGGASKPAALGAAKHACFERIARGERDASAIVRDALSTKASELFAAGVDDRDARKECAAFVQGVLRDEQLVQRIDNAATEQPLWSSSSGLYGVADAVVEDAVTGRTPLELKTGKGHVDHEAQAALYVAMLRGLDANWARGSHGKAGLLVRYGAKDPKPLVTSVRCSRRELTTLFAARNVVAAAVENTVSDADDLTGTAPAVLGDGRGARARCYQSEACALRHFASRAGLPRRFSVVIGTSVLLKQSTPGLL